MKAAVFAYSQQGKSTAKLIMNYFKGEEVFAYTPERFTDSCFQLILGASDSGSFYERQFSEMDVLIFVGACGIAVRAIAPYIRSKVTDPAVLCVDDLAQFVIPILSGHIGGANEFAKKLAAALNATPVITTATDIHQRFSVDSWAARNDYIIGNLSLAKKISAAILEQDIPLSSQLPLKKPLPNGIYAGNCGKLGIFLGWEKSEPFENTLRIIPPCVHLGIGCRRGTSADMIRQAVRFTFEKAGIDLRSIKCAASIDLKADEPGLLEFCREDKIPINFYTAEELASVQGSFSHSDFVQKVTGIDNICERAASAGADVLIIKKTAADGITIAAAAEMKEVSFE